MGADAGLQAHETGSKVGEPNFDLSARQPFAQHDSAALVEADQVKGILADVDAERGDGSRL